MCRQNPPALPRDEWFVKKTLNRLPPKRKPVFSPVELTSIAGVAIMIVAMIVSETIRFSHAEEHADYDLTMLTIALVSSIVMTLYIAIPIIRRL